MKGRADKMSSPLERRLNAYAIAASAAGVGLLALSPSAEARVIYTPAHLHIGVDSTLLLDLNHDGIIDFTIHNHFFFTTTPVAVELWVNPRHKNAVRGIPNRGYGSASALEAGINVKQQNGFLGAGQKFGPLMADWFTSRSISYSQRWSVEGRSKSLSGVEILHRR